MFIRLSSLAIVLLACQALAEPHHDHGNPFGYTPNMMPLQENAGTDNLFLMEDCSGFKLHEATFDEMQDVMSRGELTSVQLVACYLVRTYQTQEYIHSVLQVNPDVFAIAAERDAERRQGKVRGPLHGIPFTVKDNIASKDNLETTAGSWALLGSIVPRDAHVVKKLREAGAVLFGKAALSEWADMRSNDYSEGYSARGGQVRRSETDGSVINPASRNALVGIKPTVGLTSRAGVIPESEHQDSVGILVRTVKDATLVLDAIYGIDEHDNYTLAQKGKTPAGGYTQFLTDKTALQGAASGSTPTRTSRRSSSSSSSSSSRPARTIVNNTEITDYETLVSPDGWNWDWGSVRGFPNESEYTYIKVDFYNNIKSYLAEFNLDNAGSEGGTPGVHPAFASGQDGFLAALATRGVRDEAYWQALDFCQTKCRRGIDDALTHSHNGTKTMLAGLLVPPQVAQAPQIAAQAGYPVITLPAGLDAESGMPFGLGIMQTAWGEAELVRWASAIEDLQRTSGTPYKRQLPTWRGYLERNLPVPY
ncbi:amidase signature domain-containing protein [Ganoderma leucocontextum]|nr:amidase signature domain-containing protein [Ganoderma leucocontextum]